MPRLEFKLTKGQLSQYELIQWGCRYNGRGKDPEIKQVEQLSQ